MPRMSAFLVVLFKNKEPTMDTQGVELEVKPSWNFATFKKKASSKLKIKVKRVFLDNGSEIQEVDEMSKECVLYLSSGMWCSREITLVSFILDVCSVYASTRP